MPYLAGAWSCFPGYGWGWQAGGAWNGLNYGKGSIATGAPTGTIPKNGLANTTMHAPLRPGVPQAPATGATKASLVMSNEKPMVMSKPDREGNFVFQKDSAGLGVPRGSLGNLNHVANGVGRHGPASMPVYASARWGETGGSAHGAGRGLATLRAVSARGASPRGRWRDR